MRWSCLVILTVCCLLALPELVQCCCQGDDAPTTDKDKDKTKDKPRLHPIVFVPDIGGNMLYSYTKYDDEKCNKIKKGFYLIFAKNLDADVCLIEKLRLKTTGISNNISTKFWGSMESVNYVTPLRKVDGWFSTYYERTDPDGDYAIHFTNKMKELGYTEDKDLVAAPYDFRMAPESHHIEYFPRLKRLVESTYKNNGNLRVVLMGHGLGGVMANHFLERQSPEWKLKYVHVIFPVAVPWAGYVKALYDYETGGFFKTDSLEKKIKYREIYRTWETAELLLPHGQAWNKTGLFLKDYDISPIDNTFWLHFKKSVHIIDPGVQIMSLVSTGVPTIESLELHDEKFPSVKHTLKYGDGDGIVNSFSLKYAPYYIGFNIIDYTTHGHNHQQVLSSELMIGIMKHINGLKAW